MRSEMALISLLLVECLCSVGAFVQSSTGANKYQQSTTQLAFGIPSFLTPKNENDENDKSSKKKASTISTKNVAKSNSSTSGSSNTEEKKIGLKGVLQLIAAGAGAPFLGDFEGVDKETGKFMFSLEANNLVDEKGESKQTQMPYFENGWVDENDTGFQWPWEQKKTK
jgi:hypothetical protein